MNISFHPLIRAAAFAAALAALSIPSHASAQSADKALQVMALTGSVSLEKVAPDIQVGSPVAAVSEEIGHPSRILADGTWLFYRNFYVTHSSAHGTLAISVKDGRVSALKLVSPNKAVELVAHSGRSAQSAIASSR